MEFQNVPRESLSEEQRKLLDLICALSLRGYKATPDVLAHGLTWPVEKVERVGRELTALGLITPPDEAKS
jgi:hypothetical protein